MKTSAEAIAFPRLRVRVRSIRIAEFLMLGFLLITMGLPLLFLLVGSFNLAPPGKAAVYGVENWLRAFSDPGTIRALWMSFLLSLIRLIPAMVLAVLFAWLIARTDMPGGKTIEALCWIAYFVPDFPLTLAWILLLDPHFGFLNAVGKSLPFIDGPVFNPYSFWGIVWVHTSTGGIWFKVMLLVPVFRRLGASLEEAARVAGASTPTRIYVYSTRIYDYLQREPRAYGEATALGSVFLLVLALLLTLYWRYLSGKRGFAVVT